MSASAFANTYLFPEPQLLLLLLLSVLILRKLAPRELALVEAREVFLARGRVEVDFLLVHRLDLALLVGGRRAPHFCVYSLEKICVCRNVCGWRER